ncbi:TPA: hypothetical protein P6266_004063 [Escherichia coli]|nr:hypothetical protein [Escherichia coli]HDP7400245.1 hypothetical protein [Escherichia coli]
MPLPPYVGGSTLWKLRWNGEPFNRVIEAEDINDCYDHWMLWAQIAHADVTNIRIEELKEHQAA